MDYLSATDAKPTTEINSLWWKIDEHFDSSCEKEENDIDDDFVLKFSTDESDCEEDDSHSDGTYYDRPAVSEDLAKNCSDNSSMQNNLFLSVALRYGDKITNTTRSVRRRNVKSKVINNQRSVLDYFRQHDVSDDKVADAAEIKKDQKADVIVDTQKLMRQLLNVRVILERLPDSLLVKKVEPNHDDCPEYQETTCKTKRYCDSCDRTFIRSNNCPNCNSVLKYECPKCGIRYPSSQRLGHHQRTKCFNHSLNYQCSQCNYSSPRKQAIENHIEAIHVQSDGGKRKSFLCFYCQKNFLFYWELLRHKKICKQTDRPKLADNSKKRKLSSCEFLDINIRKKARFDNFVKVFCSKCANTKVLHQDEIPDECTCWDRSCNSALRYECAACGKQYLSPTSVLNHFDSKYLWRVCQTQIN